MIKSMTGFGKSEFQTDNKKITIEIKALNSKQLDLSMRLSGDLKPYEYELRNKISAKVQRGKVDVAIMIENLLDKTSAQIDYDVVKAYHAQLEAMTYKLGIKMPDDIMGLVTRFPGIFATAEEVLSDDLIAMLNEATGKALIGFDTFRMQEGQVLKNEILSRIDLIMKLLLQVEPFELQRKEQIKTRLTKSLNELMDSGKFDENRFEQELIYYLEKLDITEEKVRLQQHCEYFIETIDEDNSGKKLGFISQEIGREINTLGSKANDVAIQRIVVQMKDELEKIKEQLFNIL
ncbi:MAG: YicC family protein [Bacteroidales bacterium]|nr:YicC family protein [Bacteroidales bacterium]